MVAKRNILKAKEVFKTGDFPKDADELRKLGTTLDFIRVLGRRFNVNSSSLKTAKDQAKLLVLLLDSYKK